MTSILVCVTTLPPCEHPLWRRLGMQYMSHSTCRPRRALLMVKVAGAVGEWLPVRRVTFISHSQAGQLAVTPSIDTPPPPVFPVSSYLKFSFGFFVSFHGRRGHSLEEPAGSRCVPHSDHARLSSASRTDMLPLSTQSLAHTSPRCFPFSFLPRHTAYLFTPWPVLHFFRSLVTCWPWEYLPITCIACMCERQLYWEMQMGC